MSIVGTENIWDYPRPPRIEPSQSHVIVMFNKVVIADTRRAIRILETSHPPSWYIPPEDVRVEFLKRTDQETLCEWKGMASYYSLEVEGKTSQDVAWCYAEPTPEFQIIRHYLSFYPGRVDACTVDGELVSPEPGDFYGGWITSNITGMSQRR